jgi:tRNA A-37 threonylcarbamoyl transferase component Bud32
MIGRTLEHYRVEALLGRGGMGVVYRAVDTRLHRPVALKVLAEDLVHDRDRRARFLQEARAASAVNHPAIAQIYDVGESEGVTFLAMELVEGRTVRQLVADRELDVLGAVEVALQVARGLAAAHEAGIVHRDIKADNVMVTRDGHAKILDFGLAKLLDPARTGSTSGASRGLDPSLVETVTKTQMGMVLGTVAYMSPEQARGQTIDHRSDLFSVGIVLYEMVTGQLPFQGQSPIDTMYAIAFEETRAVQTLRPSLPGNLQRIVSRCMRKRPDDRYATARDLVRDLEGLRRELESGVSQGVPLMERLQEGWRALRDRSPAEWIWVAALAVAGLGLLTVLVWKGAFWGVFFFLVLPGLLAWRRMRNRRKRFVKSLAAKAKRFPEVRLVAFDGNRVTVVVDRAVANTYVRIHALADRINSRMFFGEPIVAAVRDTISPEELKALLEGPGVLFVRGDVLGEAGKQP